MPGIPSQDAVLFTGAATTHSRDTQTSQGLSSPGGGYSEKLGGARTPTWGGVTGHGLSPPSPTAPLGPQIAAPLLQLRGSGCLPTCPLRQVGVVPRVFGCPQPRPRPRGTRRPAWHAPVAGAPSPKAAPGVTTGGVPMQWGGSRSVLRCPGLCRTPPSPAFSSSLKTIVNPESRAP